MDKGVKIKEGFYFRCSNCIFLSKQKIRLSKQGHCYSYGCNARTNDYIPGWIKKDSELKTMGCSYCNKLKFGDHFIFNGVYDIFYLGLLNGKRLLYNAQYKTYKLVSDNWFRKHGYYIRVLIRYGKDKMCIDLRREGERRIKK